MGFELAPESDLDALHEFWIVAPAQSGEHAGQVVLFQASPVAFAPRMKEMRYGDHL